MGLDIRIPIGFLFVSLGFLLAAYGLVSNQAIYERSLDININLWWGLVMLAFGILMVLFGYRAPRMAPPTGEEPPTPPEKPGSH